MGVPGVRVITRRALPSRWQRRRREEDDRGSITAYLLITTVAIFALAGLVLDGGAALAAHGRAADVAQQAARAGADALDETSLRSATPAGLTANPAAARTAAGRGTRRGRGDRRRHRERGQRHRHRPGHQTCRDPEHRRYQRGRRDRDGHRQTAARNHHGSPLTSTTRP